MKRSKLFFIENNGEGGNTKGKRLKAETGRGGQCVEWGGG